MIVLCAGMQRSGTRWYYNLIHDLMVANGCPRALDVREQYGLSFLGIARLAEEMGVRPIPLGPAFAESLREGRDPYRSRNHLNEQSQRVIARTLRDPILEALSSRIA